VGATNVAAKVLESAAMLVNERRRAVDRVAYSATFVSGWVNGKLKCRAITKEKAVDSA